MKIYAHCGNFKTTKEALEIATKLSKQVLSTGKVLVRKRTTSIDKENLPFEVVIEYK